MINKLLYKRVISSVICFGMVFIYTTPFALAASSNITGVNPTQQNGHNVYNIEASKVSGQTGFRQYDNFNLIKGDIANLIYKNNYSKFVNLVNDQININGIINTMKDNAFYNGHAIFVSPKGIVIGSSGVLNVGSLTLMAPSENAFNSFKNSYENNLKDYEFNLNHDNYKSLIKNSSGTIEINGRVFARKEINAYARTINIQKEKDSEGKIKNDAVTPGLFAGWQNEDKVFSSNDEAETIFNELVSNNITKADSFNLKDGKISLITNKTNEENIVSAKNIEESGKKYKQTETINTDTGLKTVVKEELKDNGEVNEDADKETVYSIDKTYENNSLSDKDSIIKIEDSNIAANNIKITAKAETTKMVDDKIIENYGKAAKDAETQDTQQDETTGYKIPKSFTDVAPEAVAKVTIKNSKIGAEKVEVNADAKSQNETYIQLIDPIWEKWIGILGEDLLLRILSAMDDEVELPDGIPVFAVESVKSYFSDSTYKYFDGSKSTANVILTNAIINASKSIDINSNAKSVTKISTGKLDSHELFFYGLGSGTDSKINIKNSKLTAKGDSGKVNISAFSEIKNKIKYDSSNFLSVSEKEENGETTQQNTVSAYNFALLNNSIISDTEVSVSDNTEIETKDLKIKAVGYNQNEINVKNISNVGKDSDKSGISAGMIINHTDTNSKVSVKDSNLKTSNNTTLLSQNINTNSNSVTTEVKAKDQTYEIKDKDKAVASYDPTYTIKGYEWLNKKLLGKVTDKVGDVIDKANLEISGSAIWNDENNKSSVITDKSVINSKNLDINSNIIDYTNNSSIANATSNSNLGVGTAIIVNGQTNTNNAAIINGSKITAKEGVNLNSTTQLPMNPLSLKIGQKADDTELYVGVGFDQNDEIDSWDAEFLHTELTEFLDLDNIKSVWNVIKTPRDFVSDNKIELDGLFNNLVKAEGTGTYGNVAGSVLANSILNNTSAYTDGSEVTVDNGNVALNSANSVINYNGAGKVDFLLDGVNKLIEKIKAKPEKSDEEKELISKFGLGGSVLVGSYTNNANAYINNSSIKAENGDINVNAASEEGYINLAVTGAEAKTLAVAGSVNVHRTDGKTKAYIADSNTVKANNVTVNAGKASIKTKKKDDEHSDDINLDEDNELYVNDARDVEDRVLNIDLLGVNSQQEGSGISLGASVNVNAVSKEITSYINNSTVNASSLSVLANTASKKIAVVMAGAFAGGVSPDKEKQQKNNDGSTDSNGGQKMANAGNWMDILDNANEDDEDILGLQNLFDENNPNEQGAANARNNRNNINNQNNRVDQNGNNTVNGGQRRMLLAADNNGNGGNNPGNNNGNLAGGVADPQNAAKNFSIALAGSVSADYDESSVASEIINSTINVEKTVDISADRDNLVLNVDGGLAKTNNIGAGAAVNVYTDKGGAKATVNNTNILFASDLTDKQVNVKANDEHYILNVAAGVGAATGNNGNIKAAVGGSFNTNRLLGTTEAKIVNNSKIKNQDGKTNDIDVNVKAQGDTTVWNTGGAGTFTSSGNSSTGLGASVAGNMDILRQSIKSEISNAAAWGNIKDVDIESKLQQDINSISVAGNIVSGTQSSYNIDGALGLEFIGNNVTALLKNSTITSSGNVNLSADSDIKGQTLTGDLSLVPATGGIAAGIGAVIGIDNSTVSAVIDNSNINNSAAVESKANSADKRKFLAVNFGVNSNNAHNILANGVVNIYKTNVESKVINNSSLKSSGAVEILSKYENENQSITAVADKTANGLSLGANILASYYGNNVTSELQNGSKILQSGSVRVDAATSEYINYIPVSVAVASGGGSAVAADIAVNVIKNSTNAYIHDNVTTTGSLTVRAIDDTSIYERGGVLAYAGGTAGIAGTVYYDYLNKNVNAEVKGSTVSAGNMTVQATAENSFGGTKKEDGSWDLSDISTNKNDYGANWEQGAAFKNWNMAYSLAHGDSASVSGAVIVRVIDDAVKANVENVNLTGNELTVYANDYTIMNTIAGQFSPGTVGVGGNAIIVIGNTNTTATLINGTQTIANDLKVMSNTQKDSRTVMIGGSGSASVAVNGAAYVNLINDKTKSVITGSNVNAGSVLADAVQKNTSLGVDLSVAASGMSSIGGILYLNLFNDTTSAVIGDNLLSRTYITANNNIKVNSDSDYEMREYLLSIGASAGIAISALGISNVIDSNVAAEVNNSDVNSTTGKLDVNAYRGLNREQSDKTAFFRNWFKGTNAYATQNSTITSNDLNAMAPLTGAINVAASGAGSGAGTIIVNKMRGELSSKIDNSNLSTSQGADVLAQQDFVNFDAVASVAAAGTGAGNFVGVINSLEENVLAEIKNSNITNGAVKTDAKSNINFNQLVLSGQGAGAGGAVGVVVDSNNIKDNVYSSVTGTVTSADTEADAAHNVMINNILLAGGGVGAGVSAQVVPVINEFKGSTIAKIDNNSSVNGGNIVLNSHDYIDNLSAVVGVTAAGSGANLSGYAIRNDLSNTANSYINNSTVNTTGNIGIDTYSVIDSTNAIFSAGIVGTGVSVLANVISNTIESDVKGYISNSAITKAGDIKITANKDNSNDTNRYDKITNTTGNVSFAAGGAAISSNVIYNNYKNKVQTYIDNTTSEDVGSVTAKANSERRLNNTNIGIGAAAIGGSVGVNAVSTNIDTTTYSYIDAKSKTMNNVGAIIIRSNDDTDLNNTMGTIQVAGIGVAAGVNLDMTTSDNIVKSEILSATNGQINAISADIKSDNLIELDKTNVGVSLGAIGLAGDYVLIQTGKRTGTYNQSEQDSSIVAAINRLDSKYRPTATPSDIETGSISGINGNLKTSGDISVAAESKIKGRGNNDQLTLSNTTVTVGLGTGSVGVKEVNLASNTDAGISGGTVQSTGGNISSNAKSTSNVQIKSVEVNVSGVNFGGGSSIYKNSSETTSKIKDATLKANDITVNSESTSNSNVDATYVTANGLTVVAVDLAENKDDNKSVAIVTGNTNIDAAGKLTIHSKANTDLSSQKQTVRVSGATHVSVSRNEVNSSTIARAIIENVNGTINTNGLDIITDYDRMNTLNKTNVIDITLAGIASVDKTGAFMNSNFKSGIDSPTGLILNNIGDTNIIAARDNGTRGMVAKGEIYNVKVSVQEFLAVSTANAQNTAKSETVLKSNEFTTNNLNINSYLNSSAKSEATGTKVNLGIGVNSVTAEANDSATLDIQVGGNNTVLNNAIIKATNSADVNTELSAFNFSLLAGGGRSRINSTLTSNTTGTIGGNFNANKAAIDINSTRSSRVSQSSGAGGIIAINDSEAKNTLTGSSTLILDGLFTDADKGLNQWNISNKSDNTMDIVTSDGSGGFITMSSSEIKSDFNTRTDTIVKNSNINSKDNVGFTAENKAVIKDSATSASGGFISCNAQNVKKSYFSAAKLTLKDSKVEAKNLELTSHAEMKSPDNIILEYRGRSGGFVTVNSLTIENNLYQTSEIDIKNSILHATNDAIIHALTTSGYKQKIDSRSGGFVTVPTAILRLYSNNSNTISLDAQSKVLADSKLKIDFDSNSNLYTSSTAVSKNFGGQPSAYSYLYYTANNTLNDNGSLQAGELVDIDFMNNSINTLVQYAYAECHAAVAATDEKGLLSRTINNAVTVAANADITSGNSVNISYLTGGGTETSTVAYKNVHYAAFGIPITDEDNKPKISNSHSKSLKLDGKIVAGVGNNKYVKIDRDGTVNMDESKEIYSSDYTLFDNAQAEGATVKSKTISSIDVQIENVTFKLNDVDLKINNTENAITEIESKITPIQTELDNIDTLVSNGAVYKNIQVENNSSEFYDIVNNDVKTSSGLSDDVYNIIIQKYKEKFNEVTQTNTAIAQHNSDPANVNNIQKFVDSPSIIDFLNGYTGDDITQDEKNAFITKYNAAYNDRMTTNTSGVRIYTDLAGNKYIGATKVVDADNKVSWQEITNMNNQITEYNNEKAPYETQLANYNETKTNLNNQKNNLINERTIAQNKPEADYVKSDDGNVYSIVFSDIKAQNSEIAIMGGDVDNTDISGTGNFVITPSGLKVDNYSTRSLIFNSVDFDLSSAANSLKINDKTYSEFLNKPQALNTEDAYHYKYGQPRHHRIDDIMHPRPVPSFDNLPTDGVHFISQSSGQESDIIINNYYDVNHPFANTFNIPNPTTAPNISFLGNLGKGQISIRNESGSVLFLGDSFKNSKADIYTPNGNIMAMFNNSTNDTTFGFSENSNMFAGGKVTIIADAVDLKGNINIGYKDRAINITDDMLLADNLIFDATSGEKNLINLGGNTITPYLNDGINYGNIKAIYKDGQIYLYNIPENTKGGIQIYAIDDSGNLINSSGSISSNLNYNNGYSNIDIVNKTAKTLNIGGLSNINNNAGFDVHGLNTDNMNKTETVISKAVTNITSDGQISVNGVIRNNLSKTENVYNFQDGGELNIVSKNGIDIKKIGETPIIPTVTAGGNINITNTDSGKILIDGDIENKGNINVKQENAGKLILEAKLNETDGLISVSNINSDDILIEKESSITSKKGNIEITNDGTSAIYQIGPITAEDGEISIKNTKGAIYSGSDIIAKSDIVINNTSDNLVIGNPEDGDEFTNYQIVGTTNGNISISNINGNMVFAKNAVIANLSEATENNNYDIDIINVKDSGALAMYIDGHILNTAGGDINILNYGQDEAIIGGTILNTDGDINVYNASDSLTFKGEITASKGKIDISNNGNEYLHFNVNSLITANDDISITNQNGGNVVVEGLITSEKGDITLTNSNSDILIGEYATTNNNYLKAEEGNVVINQTKGGLFNAITDTTAGKVHQNSDIGNPDRSYKTLISTNKDLIINIIDGDIGSAGKNAAKDTKAGSRDYTDSVNVNVKGTVTATAKNQNNNKKRVINLRSKESDMNIKNIDVDGDVLITAADWKQADNVNGSDDPSYYIGYSVKNSAAPGQYAVKGQNISIISSNTIGTKNNKLTVLQDSKGNPDSTLNTFAEKSIYFDGKSNDANDELSIGTMRTKSEGGTIGIELSSDANIDTIITGGTINIKQKAKDLAINTISMYGNNEVSGYDTAEDILYPHDRISSKSSGNGRIVLKALDAYATGKSDSTITVNKAYIQGLGLGISDVELHGDNITFNAISKSNMSKNPVVFDIRGVSKDEVNAVADSTRNNYKYTGGHYLADNANINIETNSKNNNGVIISTIYANNADVRTNNTKLTVKKGFIDEYGTFVNGNIFTSGYNHTAVVNNKTKGLVNSDYQMYTKETGDFVLGMDGTIVLITNAPVVHYDNDVLVNGYNSENSFTRLTLKENVIQQVAKFVHEKIMPTDILSLKVQDVKLDTSDIIMDEIINYNISEDNDEAEENKNISLKD